MSLQALREKRTNVVAQMRGIIDAAEKDNRDLTAEEQTSFDELKAEETGLATRIERYVGLEASTAALDAVTPAAARGNGPGAIGAGGRGPEAKKDFESIGEFLAAVRFNPNDQRLNFVEGVGRTDAVEEGGEIRAEFRMDNDTSGGFMVPPQLRTEIMRVSPETALVRPRAAVIPPGSPPDAGVIIPALDQSGSNPQNMYGGVDVQWIGEGQQKPETDGKLNRIQLEPQEVAGFVTVTDKLLRNWQAASAFIGNLLRGATTAAEERAFLRGNGVNQPLGAINSAAMYFVHRAIALHVGYDDLVAMVSRVLMRDGTSPIWTMPQGALPDLAKMTDPEGHYIWKANAVDGFAGSLLGYPVRWYNRAPLLGTKGDISLNDWSNYLIKDGSGPFVAASEHVKFLTNETVIKIFWNVDGAPWLTAPVTEENGYQVSPFVGLDVP